VPDARLVERRKIRIAFDEDERPLIADGVLGEIQAVEKSAFRIEGGVGRIEVLGLDLGQGPASEGHYLAGQAENREDDPAPEPVVVFSALAARKHQAAFFENRDGNAPSLEMGQEGVP
jgi:hypothetical protein